jgi:hypothetical protein
VAQRLEASYPSTSFQTNTRIVDGLEMGLYILNLRLNIEVDDPYHHTKAARVLGSKRMSACREMTFVSIESTCLVTRSAAQGIADVLSSFGVQGKH